MIPEEVRLEMAVYIARKTGWTLDYISQIPLIKLVQFYKELTYQDSVDKWETNYLVSQVLAAIYNTIPRQRGSKSVTYKDFLSESRPTRGQEGKTEMEDIDRMAKDKGIIWLED